LAMVSDRAPGWLTLPLPLQLKLVTPVGSGSLTLTLVATLGPLLRSEERRVGKGPGSRLVTLSVFVTRTSTCGLSVSMSVAVWLWGVVWLAALMLTRLVSVQVAAALAAGTMVYVTLAPTPRLAMVSDRAPGWLTLPLPLQLKLVTPVGSGSLTLTLVATLGPLL